nr:MAG TPA: hypothetical protein [Caudoviricetes sp.]
MWIFNKKFYPALKSPPSRLGIMQLQFGCKSIFSFNIFKEK